MQYMEVIFFFIGAILGSFLNAWIWRTHVGASMCRGRSACPQCKKALSWYENLPILSFVLQKGRCRECHASISLQYPLVELSVGLLFAFTAWFHGNDSLLILRDCFILFFLTFTFVYDVRYQEIWDRMTMYPATVLVVATVWFDWLSIPFMLIGVLVGMGFFFLQYLISRGRWIGGGDIQLGLFMGVILGWPLILLALFLAYIGGALFVLPFLLLGKKQMATKVPFGAYLSIATVVTMFWGKGLVEWYIGLLM